MGALWLHWRHGEDSVAVYCLMASVVLTGSSESLEDVWKRATCGRQVANCGVASVARNGIVSARP
jgi:hypothetical protein